MNFYWFRYIWIGILIVMYVAWTIGTFVEGCEDDKIEWVGKHIVILLFSSLMYFIYTLVKEYGG